MDRLHRRTQSPHSRLSRSMGECLYQLRPGGSRSGTSRLWAILPRFHLARNRPVDLIDPRRSKNALHRARAWHCRWIHRTPPPAESSQRRSEEHTSELQSLMRISYAVFCVKKKQQNNKLTINNTYQSHTSQHTL